MTKIKSPADLKQLREKSQKEIDLRQGPKDIRITVHLGTCGIAAGAREVLRTILEELAAAGIDYVSVQQAGCIGLCEEEPMITLTTKNGAIYRYGRLDRSKTSRVVREHLLRGAVVQEYLLRDRPHQG